MPDQDWPQCAAGCGWPLDPAAGGTSHPGCDLDHQHRINHLRHQWRTATTNGDHELAAAIEAEATALQVRNT